MKKKIFGITVLFAVLAMCFTFTACPQPEDNSVTFINETAIDIRVNIKGGISFPLAGLTSLTGKPDEYTVTKSGDIVLQTVDFSSSSMVAADPSRYINLEGSITGGKQKYRDGYNLGSGTIRFTANREEAGNPAIVGDIKVIPLDD